MRMKRREFLKTLTGFLGALSVSGFARASRAEYEVMTVRGGVKSDLMGVTLPHEHLLADFIGADRVNRNRYDADEVFEVVLPYLQQARELGLATLVDCTPAYLGRDPGLLKRLSEASGIHILTNTGYYGAASGKFLPQHTHEETPDQLAARWIREWEKCIEGTDIRPGFIKTGVDAAPLSEVNRKLVKAAARTHLATGLAIASHTGGGAAAMEQLAILAAEGVEAGAFIWVHAQSERDHNLHIRAAEKGAWIEFDGLRPQAVSRHLELAAIMKHRGLLGRALVSHDAGWYEVGKPRGGNFRPFDVLFTRFIPALKENGFTSEEVSRLTTENPREAFSIRVRASK